MPIATCLYCGKVTVINLWDHACQDCFRHTVLPALKAQEKRVPVPGSLCSYLPGRIKKTERHARKRGES
jgi:hypothetical protein